MVFIKMREMCLTGLAVLLLTACSGQGVGGATTQTARKIAPVTPSVPLSQELLAFCGFPGTSGDTADIYLVYADGSHLTPIPQLPFPKPRDNGCHVTSHGDVGGGRYYGSGLGLTWSPDGKLLIFSTDAWFSLSAVSVDSVDSEVRLGIPVQLWHRQYGNNLNSAGVGFEDPLYPALSPDGKRLAIYTDTMAGNAVGMNVWTIDLDGNNPLEMSKVRGLPQAATEPAWSPDGQWVAFGYAPLLTGAGVTRRDGNESYVLSNETLPSLLVKTELDLTFSTPLFPNYRPSWYPDSKRFLFVGATGSPPRYALFRYDLRTKSVSELMPGNVYEQTLSPQGTGIAYVSYFDEWNRASAAIMLADPDGQNAVEILRLSRKDGSGIVIAGLVWSPDGTRLAFSSNFQGGMDIYVVNADGANLTDVTHRPGMEVLPKWRPRTSSTGP